MIKAAYMVASRLSWSRRRKISNLKSFRVEYGANFIRLQASRRLRSDLREWTNSKMFYEKPSSMFLQILGCVSHSSGYTGSGPSLSLVENATIRGKSPSPFLLLRLVFKGESFEVINQWFCFYEFEVGNITS